MDQFDLEKAYQFVKRALDIDPNHIQALETMASVQMEMGNTESAKNISFRTKKLQFLIIFCTFNLP